MTFERMGPEQFDSIPDIPDPAQQTHLFGHDEIAGDLARAYREGALHHALMLAGPAGIGKATFAFHLAHHLLSHPDRATAPANLAQRTADSPLSRQIAGGAHPSILHLTRPLNEKAKNFRAAITVDEIRRINRFLSMTSHDGSYRCVIVDPADDMNVNAANALLKSLEEPPPRTLMMLVVHAPGRILPTLRSRCRMVRFKPLGSDDLMRALSTMPVDAAPSEGAARAALVERSEGSVREALLLTQFGGLEIAEAVEEVLGARAFPMRKAWRIAEVVAGKDAAVQFDIFSRHAADIVLAGARRAGEGGDGSHADRLAELWEEVGRMTGEAVTYNLDRKQHVMAVLTRLHDAGVRTG